jgi:mRNA interferase MazF
VVSVDEISTGLEDELIVIVPLSSSRAASPLRPEVYPEEGVERDSVAVCRAIRAVARKRLLHPVGRIRPHTLDEVERVLGMILGIESGEGSR